MRRCVKILFSKERKNVTDLALVLNQAVTTLNKAMGVSHKWSILLKEQRFVWVHTKETCTHKRVVGAVAFTVGVTAKQHIGRLLHKTRERWRRNMAALKEIKWMRKFQTGKTSEQNLHWFFLFVILLCLAMRCDPSGAERTFLDAVRAVRRAEFPASPARASAKSSSAAAVYQTLFGVVNVY